MDFLLQEATEAASEIDATSWQTLLLSAAAVLMTIGLAFAFKKLLGQDTKVKVKKLPLPLLLVCLLFLTGCASKLDRAFMEKNGQNIDHADKLFQVYEMSESEKAAHAAFFKTWRELNNEFKKGID